jgi:nitrogen fixation NifU-like protein
VDDLYRENILDHYKRPRHFGRPESFDLDYEDTNPFCGDEQHIYIELGDDDRVTGVSFEGKGCAISTAATSMLTEELNGKTREELLRMDKEFVLELLGIDISATRMKCALLGLKVVKSAALGNAADWEEDADQTVADPAAERERI